MHHDNFHGAVFQHMTRRALAGGNISHAAGQGIHARQGTDFTVIDNDQVEMGQTRKDQLRKPLPDQCWQVQDLS